MTHKEDEVSWESAMDGCLLARLQDRRDRPGILVLYPVGRLLEMNDYLEGRLPLLALMRRRYRIAQAHGTSSVPIVFAMPAQIPEPEDVASQAHSEAVPSRVEPDRSVVVAVTVERMAPALPQDRVEGSNTPVHLHERPGGSTRASEPVPAEPRTGVDLVQRLPQVPGRGSSAAPLVFAEDDPNRGPDRAKPPAPEEIETRTGVSTATTAVGVTDRRYQSIPMVFAQATEVREATMPDAGATVHPAPIPVESPSTPVVRAAAVAATAPRAWVEDRAPTGPEPTAPMPLVHPRVQDRWTGPATFQVPSVGHAIGISIPTSVVRIPGPVPGAPTGAPLLPTPPVWRIDAREPDMRADSARLPSFSDGAAGQHPRPTTGDSQRSQAGDATARAVQEATVSAPVPPPDTLPGTWTPQGPAMDNLVDQVHHRLVKLMAEERRLRGWTR